MASSASAAVTDEASTGTGLSSLSLSSNQSGNEIRRPGTRAPDDLWAAHTRPVTALELAEVGKKSLQNAWRCIYCLSIYSGRSVARLVAHVACIKGQDIAVCKHPNADAQAGLSGKVQQLFKIVPLGASSSVTVAAAAAAAAAGADDGQPAAKRQRQMTMIEAVDATRNAEVERLLCEAWCANGLSWRLIEDKRFLAAIRAWVAAGLAFRPPDRQRLAGPVLDDTVGRVLARVHAALEGAARPESGGATLVTDGMTHLNRPSTNMLVYHPDFGVLSLSVIDSTEHLAAGGSKDADYLAQQISDTIKGVPAGSISLVVTDGASAMVKAAKLIRSAHPTVATAVCQSHKANLFCNDVGEIVAVAAVLEKSRKLALAFKNREVLRAALTVQSMEHLGRVLTTIIGSNVRFGTHFITAHRNIRLKAALEAVVRMPAVASLAHKEESVEEVVDIIEDSVFWMDLVLLVDLMWPAMLLLRLLDSSAPVMGVVVHAWRRLRFKMETLKAKVKYGKGSEKERTIGPAEVEEMIECVQNRATDFSPIMYAAYMLNPTLWGVVGPTDTEVLVGFKTYCKEVVFADDEDDKRYQAACSQLLDYKARTRAFAGADWDLAAEVGLTGGATTPARWWLLNGGGAPELLLVALKCLSQAAAVGIAERGHKVEKFVRSKVRNRLGSDTTSKIVTVHVALRTEDRLAEEEEDDDDGGGGVARALAIIDQWWAEEQEDMDAEPSLVDWGVGERARTRKKQQFRAWVEGWEGESVKRKTDDVKRLFRAKYVGMKLRLAEDDADGAAGEEELREVTEVVWNVKKKAWRLKTVLVGEEEDEEEELLLPVNKQLHLRIAAAADENPDYDIRIVG